MFNLLVCGRNVNINGVKGAEIYSRVKYNDCVTLWFSMSFVSPFCVKVGVACLDVVCCTWCLCKCWGERAVLMVSGDGEVCVVRV